MPRNGQRLHARLNFNEGKRGGGTGGVRGEVGTERRGWGVGG